MASDTKNVKLGVCSVTFDGRDLGYTKGGVEVEVSTTTHAVMVDQFGNSPINEIIMSRNCKATVPLAETTLENLAKIMPGAVLTATGGVAATGTVTFATAAPVDGDKVTVNGVDFIFKTSPDPKKSNEMAIPGSINAAASALAAAINKSDDPKVLDVSASPATAVVTITVDDAGAFGNAITLARTFTTGANCTVSGATLSGGVDASIKKIEVPHAIGHSLLNSAKRLILHPVANDPEDRSEDFVMPLANTPGAMKFAYKLEDERIFNCEFTAYPDPVTKTLFVVGDDQGGA